MTIEEFKKAVEQLTSQSNEPQFATKPDALIITAGQLPKAVKDNPENFKVSQLDLGTEFPSGIEGLTPASIPANIARTSPVAINEITVSLGGPKTTSEL